MTKVAQALLAMGLVALGGTAIAGVVLLETSSCALCTKDLDTPPLADEPATATQELALATEFLPRVSKAEAIAEPGLKPWPVIAMQPETLKAAPAPVELVPCSGWQDLGPAALNLESGNTDRHVRLLCPEGQSASSVFAPQS